MIQWMTDNASDGNYKKVTYPIAMNKVYACFVCPHINMSAMIYWNDFGYNVTNSTV